MCRGVRLHDDPLNHTETPILGHRHTILLFSAPAAHPYAFTALYLALGAFALIGAFTLTNTAE